MSARPHSEERLQELGAAIERQIGLQFSGPKASDLQTALANMARSLETTPERCLDFLLDAPWDDSKIRLCANHLTIPETWFFREPAGFELLACCARDKFADGNPDTRFKVWCAGCCTGEEAYSAAMTLEQVLTADQLARVTVLGTDISDNALANAASGIYGARSFRHGFAPSSDRRFVECTDGRYRVTGAATRIIRFAQLNLADAFPDMVRGTDFIFCRNVLMYFSTSQARRSVVRMRDSLVDGGWLVVNVSEASRELFPDFSVTRFSDAIFFRKTAVADAIVVPFPAQPTARVAHRVGTSTLPKSGAGRRPPSRDPIVPSAGTARRERKRGAAPQSHANVDQDNAQTCYLQAVIEAESGQVDQAANWLRRALYLDPEHVLASYLSGVLMAGQGQVRGAIRQFTATDNLLQRLPMDELIAGSDGITAGVLRNSVQSYLERISLQVLHAD